ncbi:hypothetical protein N665_0441s0036 [Sinapis alba]|nr:hypothetical protein N665_0441s0036 [Sinapis alba]
MSAINITNVSVLDNPAPFVSPFQFEISYECLTSLQDDLEWKLVYVGSAEDETYDQTLESVLVGPVNVGNYRFVLQADPPDPSKIREEDIIVVTVLLLTYEQLREEPPTKVLLDKVQRNILSDKPRVTKFPINFHPEDEQTAAAVDPPPPAEQSDVQQPDDNGGEAQVLPDQPPKLKSRDTHKINMSYSVSYETLFRIIDRRTLRIKEQLIFY